MNYLITIFFVLFLLTLFITLVGLIAPKLTLFWYKKKQTRTLSSLFYGLSSVIFFILTIAAFVLAMNQEDDSPKAVEVVNPQIKLTDSLLSKAKVFHTKSQMDSAISVYSRVIDMKLDTSVRELSDNRSYALQGRAKVYVDREQYDLATKDYSQVIFYAPKNPEFYVERSNTYIFQEKYQQSINDLTTALSLRKVAPYYVSRGGVYGLMGKHDLSLKDYKSALDLDKDNIKTLLLIQSEEVDLNDNAGALKTLNKVLSLDARNTDALSRRAGVKLKFNDPKGALEDADSAIKINPKDGYLFHVRGVIKTLLGRQSEACADYLKAKELGRDESEQLRFCKS